MSEEIENLVLDLKSDSKFKVLKNSALYGLLGNEDTLKLKSDLLELKSNPKFKKLKNEELHGFFNRDSGSYEDDCGRDYDEHTELESNNLKILYVKSISLGFGHIDEITIMNKIENVDVLSSSSDLLRYRVLKDKSIKKIYLDINELNDYINKNA